MDGQGFLKIVTAAFVPILARSGFAVDETTISGRLYEASFRGRAHAVSISYEPGDNALFIMVFKIDGGKLSGVDDRSKTPRLRDLNKRYMHLVTAEERAANQLMFEGIRAEDETERELLRRAFELSLVLPKYLLDEDSSSHSE